jgi:protein gp37
MSRTGIEYCTRRWNPITGCRNKELGICKIADDCWARSMAKRLHGRAGYPDDDPFKPTLHEDKLNEPYSWKERSVVCLCFMGDMWGNFIPDEWIEKVLQVIRNNDRHVFLALTKNPKRYKEFEIPPNLWCGTTVNFRDEFERVEKLFDVVACRWVSFEPMLEPMHDLLYNLCLKQKILDWIVIGAKTKGGRTVFSPPSDWISSVVAVARKYGIPVFIKDNVTTYPLIQETPKWWGCKHGQNRI